MTLDEAVSVARAVSAAKYPEATAVFLAGSIVRGEGTRYSDLDLVVVFPAVPNAHVEAYYFDGSPIEAFVHDPETIHYFITEHDRNAGVCVMAQMISEGIEILGPSALSRTLKQLANAAIASHPPEPNEEALRGTRYRITNLVDDIREPRTKAEAVATGTELYGLLANLYLRNHNLWSANGKSIPRKLYLADPEFEQRFCGAFDHLFVSGDPAQAILIAEEILQPVGGFLFEGAERIAPAEWRKKLIVR